jgi:hypothetical protein
MIVFFRHQNLYCLLLKFINLFLINGVKREDYGIGSDPCRSIGSAHRAAKKKSKNKEQIKEKFFYSGTKKRHTFKSQVLVDKKRRRVICTACGNVGYSRKVGCGGPIVVVA